MIPNLKQILFSTGSRCQDLSTRGYVFILRRRIFLQQQSSVFDYKYRCGGTCNLLLSSGSLEGGSVQSLAAFVRNQCRA